MNQQLPINDYLEQLKSYQWGKLWHSINAITPQTPTHDSLTPQLKHQLLALKAMLLTGWWQSPQALEELYPILTPHALDPVVHFALRYATLAKGQLSQYKALEKREPFKMPRWMRHWLKLEYLGRSKQDTKQIQLVNTIINQESHLPDYVAIALLQSLDHHEVNLSPLTKLIHHQGWLTTHNPLIYALTMRAGLHNPQEIESHIQTFNIQDNLIPVLRYRWANLCFAQHRTKEALNEYDQLVPTGFTDISTLQKWLTLSVSLPEGKNGLIKRVNYALSLAPKELLTQGTLASYALIGQWQQGNIEQSYQIVSQYHRIQELTSNKLTQNAQIFFRYVLSLCVVWQKNPQQFFMNTNKVLGAQSTPSTQALITLGESHSLTLANLSFNLNQHNYRGLVRFIMGIKIYHLAQTQVSYHASLFEAQLADLPQSAHLLLNIGEIDTRPDEGIWKNSYHKQKPYKEVVDATVDGYIAYLADRLKAKQPEKVIIQGIPAPGYALEGDKDPVDIPQFLDMIRYTNQRLEQQALNAGFEFLDVYSATVAEDRKGNGQWHLDGYHLTPLFYTQAQQWLKTKS